MIKCLKTRRINRAVAAGICLLALLPAPGRAQDESDLNSLKKLSLSQLMDLDVTSVERQPEPYAEAPAAIAVVTGDEIGRSGATSIPEALRLAGNLDVAEKNPHDWAISARGFNTDLSNKLLVLMDGRSLYTPLFSGVFWDAQDTLLEDVDRIEVVAGPGGSLWGANAVNGVINITTKDARQTQGGYLEAGAGSQLESFAGIREGVQVAPDVYLRVYGRYFDRASSRTLDDQDAHDGFRMERGGFRTDSFATAGTTLTLQGDLYSGSGDITTGGTAQINGQDVIGRWTRRFSASSDMSLEVYYDRTYLWDPIAASAYARAGILVDTLQTYDVDFQHRFQASARQEIVWGFGYRRTEDRDVNAPALAFYPTSLGQDLFNGFVQDEIALPSATSLILGSKFEHNDYTGFEVEPSARLKHDFAPGEMAWTAVSRAVRTPSRVDRDIAEPNPPPEVLIGESTYGDETLVAYEAGYRGEIGPRWTVSLSGFYNDYNDIRSLGYTPNTILPLFFQNDLEGHSWGGELGLAWQALPWWRLRGNYDLLREHLEIKPGGVDLENTLNETADPEHQTFIRSSMDLPGGFELDSELRWIASRIINNSGAPAITPGYSEMDLRIGWHATPRLEFSITGQNLLHRLHIEYGVPSPGLEEIERNIYGKAAWHF